MKNTNKSLNKTGDAEGVIHGDDSKIILPVIEEHIAISKDTIETGKVHIQKRVSEEEVSVNIPIGQEGYTVERKPGSKKLLSEYPTVRYDGDNIIVPVVKEVIVVEKRYEIVEEVHIIKTVSQIPHLQQITLRKETVEVKRSSTE